MPINLQNPENISTGWPGPPQLSAPNIGELVKSILGNRLARDKMTQENIADTIKQIQQQRASGAYLDAARQAGLLGEGDAFGGLDSPYAAKDATGLAALIQHQNDLAERKRHQQAIEALTGRRLDIAEADDGDNGTLDPAEQRRQDAERRREENDRLKALKDQMKLAELPKDAVPHALAPGETTQPGTYPFDVGGKRQDIPQSQVDQFNAARRTYDEATKQRAQVPQRGGGSAAGGGSPSGQYPVGTHARQGDKWYVKTSTGWQEDPNFSQ